MLRQLQIAAVSLVLSGGFALAADTIPRLDVTKTCRDAYDVLQDAPRTNQTRKATQEEQKQAFDACMASENGARDSAKQRWSRIHGENRRTCVSMASAMFPSYVELDACLQMYDNKDPQLSGGVPVSTPGRKRP